LEEKQRNKKGEQRKKVGGKREYRKIEKKNPKDEK